MHLFSRTLIYSFSRILMYLRNLFCRVLIYLMRLFRTVRGQCRCLLLFQVDDVIAYCYCWRFKLFQVHAVITWTWCMTYGFIWGYGQPWCDCRCLYPDSTSRYPDPYARIQSPAPCLPGFDNIELWYNTCMYCCVDTLKRIYLNTYIISNMSICL